MTPEQIQDSKAALRRQIRAQLQGLSPAQRAVASARASALLEQQAIWKNAQSILFYAPMPEELDIWPLVEDSLTAAKTVCLPRFDPVTKQYLAGQIQVLASDIANGQFGLREPGEHCAVVPLNALDLILVPGVAFDPQGHRLGRGKGFYDQLLARAGGRKCGVAFDEQIIGEVPLEPHDMRLDCLLTPTRWIEPTIQE